MAPGGKGSGNGNSALSKVPQLPSARNKLMNANVKTPTVKSLSSIQANGGRKSISFMQGEYVIAQLTIQSHSILLGETKYYEATVDQNDPTQLDISEITDPSKATSDRVNAQFSVQKESGDKVGAYWEYKDENGNPLPSGLIRLVGRYWQQGTTYIVDLNATTNTASGSIDIEVKKPSKLGTASGSYYDVYGNPFNLDSVIIYYAGLDGVMPQYLKAMVSVETVGYFDPCYRYEVFTDIAEFQQKDSKTGKFGYESPDYSHYRVMSPSDEGFPRIPMDHSNLRNSVGAPMTYPGYTTIWDYYWNHVSFYGLDISQTGAPQDQWSDIFRKAAKQLYNKTQEELSDTEEPVVEDSTNARFFRSAEYDDNGGMINMVAQTRICASYGILQLVYYYGSEYPQNDAAYTPEAIDDYRVGFQYGVLHLITMFNDPKVLDNSFADPTWDGGLESNYKQAVGMYNGGGDSYAAKVIQQAPDFMPQP